MPFVRVIRTQADHEAALQRAQELWEAEMGTEAGDELEALTVLIEHYENKHFPISKPTPIEAIKFRLDQLGLLARDLEPYIGSSGRVSEVLSGKRGLSLAMIKRLHDGLKIPYSTLVGDF